MVEIDANTQTNESDLASRRHKLDTADVPKESAQGDRREPPDTFPQTVKDNIFIIDEKDRKDRILGPGSY